MSARRLVIGIGNPERGDDGVGHEVIRLLEGRLPKRVGLLRATGEATELVDRLEQAPVVYLVDAARSGASPGTVQRFDAGAGPLPSRLVEVSSHGFGLAQAVELARALGVLPPRCVVYLVEGQRFGTGAALSPAVVQGAALAAARIQADLDREPDRPGPLNQAP